MIQAFKYLFSVIKWRFSKKVFIGEKILFKGKKYKIVGESYDYVIIKGFSKAVKKENLSQHFISKNLTLR